MRDRVRGRYHVVDREGDIHRNRYNGERYSHHTAAPANARGGEYRKLNWRNRDDVTSFYFTRFPEDTGEEELWHTFKKWGDVREVFIANKRNRQGRRYGFVRFKGVENILQLERALDNLMLGGSKLHVNIPKHERNYRIDKLKGKNVAYEEQPPRDTYTSGRQNNGYRQFAPYLRQPIQKTTYAQAVLKPHQHTHHRWYPNHAADITKSSASTIQLNVQVESKLWLKDAWVGRLSNLKMFDRLDEELGWEGEEDIKPRYFGEDMVLLMGLTDSNAQDFIRGEEVNGLTAFQSIEKWNPSMKPAYRLVWVLCWGVPLHAWDPTNLAKIVAAIGDMIEVDDETDDLQRLDRARVLIKTPWTPVIKHNMVATINGIDHPIYITEESNAISVRCVCRKRCLEDSSDEITSIDSMEAISEEWDNNFRQVSAKAAAETSKKIQTKKDHHMENHRSLHEDNGQPSAALDHAYVTHISSSTTSETEEDLFGKSRYPSVKLDGTVKQGEKADLNGSEGQIDSGENAGEDYRSTQPVEQQSLLNTATPVPETDQHGILCGERAEIEGNFLNNDKSLEGPSTYCHTPTSGQCSTNTKLGPNSIGPHWKVYSRHKGRKTREQNKQQNKVKPDVHEICDPKVTCNSNNVQKISSLKEKDDFILLRR